MAALKRTADRLEYEAVHYPYCGIDLKDAALIRALIERERAGGERAQIVAFLDDMAGQCIDRKMKFKTPQDEGAFDALAMAAVRIEAGAHEKACDEG